MLHFLSSLFTQPSERSDGLSEASLDKAIERAVLGTDRRLYALPDYRKRLRQPVEQAVNHAIALVEALPEPVPISAQAFGEDPRLRALFASTDRLREVCGRLDAVRDYLADLAEPPPEEIFGLLTMSREERNVFAMELQEDDLRRDVLQVAVNFFNFRYLGPAASEQDTRWELKKRAFDFLVEKALESLVNERGRRRDLARQQQLLRHKLEAMRAGRWGLGAMEDGEGPRPNLAVLESEIEAIETELGQGHTDNLGLEESLDCVADTLGRPADWLAARPVSLRLDYRGIKVSESSSAPAHDIRLVELFSSTGESRTVLFGRIVRADMPEPADFWKTAKRYL
jgi:hypothetical protein